MKQYEYKTAYAEQEKLREELNRLTRETFCFDFKEWYKNGYWKKDYYIPHSLFDGDKIVANVSANRMDFIIDGQLKHYIQLGTVMTAKEYRHLGLGRQLMEKVIDTYRGICDGIYLFGNDTVLNYYPKYGFKVSKQYSYKKTFAKSEQTKKQGLPGDLVLVEAGNEQERKRFFTYVREAVPNDAMAMINEGLMGFYYHDLEGVYYSKTLDAYLLASMEEDKLYLQGILAKHVVDQEALFAMLSTVYTEIHLGFVPLQKEGFEINDFKEEDSTLFIMGEDLDRIEKDHLIFTIYSHA
ncbi:GNAT family N-acetyltransferase [Anaerosporobacter faecicola]|uniref:GNAT family N-acetyltransferase n=1 Tax=Anaerosporobacter faecicola TaxID=2718714 RepID=UPI00143C598B|nr:GNAT family N-acetyltransferase [Anaerosporobacter faecicola]